MSSQKSATALILREYNPEPDACARALEFLLKNSQVIKGGPYDLRNNSTLETMKNGPQNEQKRRKPNVVKLTAQGYELLDSGRYVLEVVEAEAVNEYGPQLRLKLRVAEGEHEGFEFTDYPNRGAEDGVKVGTKAWDIFEACLNQRLAPDEALDTEDLIGKRFEAMVVTKKTGKGNRTEHGTIGPHRPKKAQLKEGPKVEESDDVEENFKDLPF